MEVHENFCAGNLLQSLGECFRLHCSYGAVRRGHTFNLFLPVDVGDHEVVTVYVFIYLFWGCFNL